MLEAGDSGGALEMLSQRLPAVPGLDNIEDFLAKVLQLNVSDIVVAFAFRIVSSYLRDV